MQNFLRDDHRSVPRPQVFESLKMDLKDENMKEYFVSYQGTSVVMQFVRPSHKQGLLSFAVEILGLLSLDSLSLPGLKVVIQENDLISNGSSGYV